MYCIEPLLNRFFRQKMKSVLEFDEADDSSIPAHDPSDRDPYLLYVHIPFCESLCPYCSFHRYVYDEQPVGAYFDALWKELRMYKDLGYDFTGMYIGGGTPTIDMDRLVETLRLTRDMFDIREISVETNPNHLVDEKIDRLKRAGVNRLSVGVQSFDDGILKRIGRYEKYGSGEEIRRKLKKYMGVFDTLNVDLIFNIPVQTKEVLLRDLDIVDDMLTDQVTFYPLMTAASVEKDLKKSLGPISYAKEKSFYFIILDRMMKNYTGSTAWCFSRKQAMIDEYIIAYDKYVGAGSGAFGYFNDCIYINTFSINDYIDKISRQTFPVDKVKQFTEKENMHYFLLMKLFGLEMDKRAFTQQFGKACTKALWLESLFLKLSQSMKQQGESLYLTNRGKYYWVMAMREFFIAVDTMRDYCRNMVASKA